MDTSTQLTTFNLGTNRRPFTVDVSVNPFFDLLMAIWSSQDYDERSRTHEVGEEWLDAFNEAIPADALREMEAVLGPACQKVLWIILGLVADEAPHLTTIDEAIAWIANADLQRRIIAQICSTSSSEDIDAALEGERTAMDRLVNGLADVHVDENETDHEPGMVEHLVRTVPANIGDVMARSLSAIRAAAFVDDETEWTRALERSAEAASLMIPGSQPSGLIERITNGIDFELPFGITRIVLVPSIVIRPWSMVNETGSTVVVVYPIAEEHLDDDPDAAPSWLVNYYKALGDGRRLKILRRLSNGPADLGELADLIGMAKTSTFHHIGVLRSAGLVTVHIGGSHGGTYDLRSQAFFDADGLVNKYLTIEGMGT